MNKLYEILQFNKRKINRNVKLFNARRAGILIGDELLEFHNYSYHRRTCDKDLEPSWNFNLLGNEYNSVTDKTADDVVRFIEELAGYYKDNPEYEANLCFTEEYSIVEAYECSIKNNLKKIKRNLENAVYEVTCFGKPVIYAVLDNVFESNDLQISN
ncbi:hypothetical protein H8356DRAFT_1273637 [Neocallimastix lanati (nom. inval.)]|uniref:Uncharacterized protein n=1 Tax=Neocallimastix californiae TaxID=1754190 RepID=A0A1Y2DWU0_9FUNG|nr:hypothetical protein H8356DRAFT_1273637 [Neocallimastix sp. JGI-2020a]ORY63760.1 hypothetical protein LY90DRAFT_642023 [Neocallimastix californiae]|eukprot:ORY63760.1 hypothetical protein LY90DRAFT_642023 [Neocallimastix californiae]